MTPQVLLFNGESGWDRTSDHLIKRGKFLFSVSGGGCPALKKRDFISPAIFLSRIMFAVFALSAW